MSEEEVTGLAQHWKSDMSVETLILIHDILILDILILALEN